ncbi:hypothetical protein CROQUDRAFT_132141 [Cronartium quercuum f. sp. fusiforme G11]|uniref:Uncharacterized protein n=1 Tax=Cronartium quercuum f. sp. fusiforme G11 TaxID=708437 RepID=A0A9P6NLH3_9BASI|nr:hypothetical protein CROQUDRAFT_132141 [Cronartium quercuum f. sp. fusiforme G11]
MRCLRHSKRPENNLKLGVNNREIISAPMSGELIQFENEPAYGLSGMQQELIEVENHHSRANIHRSRQREAVDSNYMRRAREQRILYERFLASHQNRDLVNGPRTSACSYNELSQLLSGVPQANERILIFLPEEMTFQEGSVAEEVLKGFKPKLKEVVDSFIKSLEDPSHDKILQTQVGQRGFSAYHSSETLTRVIKETHSRVSELRHSLFRELGRQRIRIQEYTAKYIPTLHAFWVYFCTTKGFLFKKQAYFSGKLLIKVTEQEYKIWGAWFETYPESRPRWPHTNVPF